jgi:hypothetical protein
MPPNGNNNREESLRRRSSLRLLALTTTSLLKGEPIAVLAGYPRTSRFARSSWKESALNVVKCDSSLPIALPPMRLAPISQRSNRGPRLDREF